MATTPPNPAPDDNGLATFTAHVADATGQARLSALRVARSTSPAFLLPANVSMKGLTAEEAATRHINHAFASKSLPQLAAPSHAGAPQELKSLGAEAVPLTGTTVVKFRQTFNKIPVYGSLVSVELDADNELLAINSAIGDPAGVNAVATISPARALHAATTAAGLPAPPEASPRIHYYYDEHGQWRLVYIIENLPVKKAERRPALMDFVIDAHTGETVAQLPRTASLVVNAPDGEGVIRKINVSEDHAALALRDPALNVHTYDFEFNDPNTHGGLLPGKYVVKDTTTWNPMAVSAHANAEAVVAFMRDVLKRQNIDNAGGPLHSSINCVVEGESEAPNEWFNAYWNGKQMVYGQVKVKGRLTSLAVSLEIVGHEIFHGVTEMTARLEYARQAGALNESFSDIFGVLISNYHEPDISQWNWEVGEALGPAIRDMQDPTRKGQPKHMDGYKNLPNTSYGDWGGVHTNSGIVNYAAYLVMTAKSEDGQYLFSRDEVAAMFYVALSQHLSRTSNFRQCRAAMELAVKSLFRGVPPEEIKARVEAVSTAYEVTGIIGELSAG